MAKIDEQKIEEILNRGVEDVLVKEDLRKKLTSGKKIRLYLGIDPTGADLHLGHVVVLWKLRDFQDLGHEVILLIGDFTAKIGDPTGKDEARKVLSDKEIRANFKDYKKQASKILDFSKVKIKYNSTWLSKLKFADILKLASDFTVQQMLQRDMFKRRMNFVAMCPKCGKEKIIEAESVGDNWEKLQFKSKPSGKNLVNELVCPACGFGKMNHEIGWKIKPPQPISLQEFMYPLMQGYDSVAMNVDLEVGGNDQMFNMLVGRQLQKIYNNKDKDVLTCKLLLGTDGRKMSKTFDNFVAITDNPSDMYGKLMSIKDELIDQYFEIATRLSLQEIMEIKKLSDNPRNIKAKLAKEIVKMYHGEKKAVEAEEEFNKVHRDKALPTEIPVFETNKSEYPISDLLFDTKLVSSKNEAKRLVEGGGVEIINVDKKERVSDWKKEVILENGMIIKIGSRKFVKIKLK